MFIIQMNKEYYPVRCPKCKWTGSSEECGSGDYFAQDGCSCPICFTECDEQEELKNKNDF